MGLVQPGTVENLTKEISRELRIREQRAQASCNPADDPHWPEVHLANWFFDGARADVSKVVSANPAFQLTHSFSLGSASKPSNYNFGAIFANAQVGHASRLPSDPPSVLRGSPPSRLCVDANGPVRS